MQALTRSWVLFILMCSNNGLSYASILATLPPNLTSMKLAPAFCHQKSTRFSSISTVALLVPVFFGTLSTFDTAVALAQTSKYEKERLWSEKTGQFTVRATIVAGNRKTIKLKKSSDESIVSVPVNRLCDADREFVEKYCEYVFKNLKRDVEQSLFASEALKHYQDFQARGFVDSSNRLYVESKIEAIEEAGTDDLVIVGQRMLPVAELPKLKAETQATIEQWLSLRSGEDLSELHEANNSNPTSLEAAILLSLWLEVHHAKHPAAQRRLDDAVKRGKRYLPIATPADKTNLSAAINNLAVSYARDDKVAKAIRVWAGIPSALAQSMPAALQHNFSKTVRMISSKRHGLREADRDINRKLEALSLKSNGSGLGGWRLVCPVNQEGESINKLGFFLADRTAQHISGDLIEDTRCVKCSGTDTLPCNNHLCIKGRITEETMVPVILNRRVVGYKPGPHKYHKCPTCRGDGLVRCPFCDRGMQK